MTNFFYENRTSVKGPTLVLLE